jgi:hypothetical protein
MREVDLLRKLNNTYNCFGLSRSKLYMTLIVMFFTSVLEMAGLSILYPLVLMMGNKTVAYASYKLTFTLFSGITPQIMFCLVALLILSKNIALYFTYNNNINFAIYFYRNLVKGLYEALIKRNVISFRLFGSGLFANTICTQTGKVIDGVLRPLLVILT